ncbi:NLI interacting factor-like phosphatase [Novymonas esmeraldas]|uniref:Mitochondrial import inner membrane translocase subunit TIM50 n=1 Tax=Novymonas esmeraldas TaxID=1808958 RepID=A0AAW0ERI0_9TRYP
MSASVQARANSCPSAHLPLAPSSTSLSTITRVWNERLRASSLARSTTEMEDCGDVLVVTPAVAKLEGHVRTGSVATSSRARLGAASGVEDGLTDSPAATISSRRRTVVKETDALTADDTRSHSAVVVRRRVDPGAEDMASLVKPLFPRTLLTEGPDDGRLLTLVLDLDETLVFNRDARQSAAVLRPYCLHVLNALRHMTELEIVLWTASTKETASHVVKQLHQTGIIFDDIVFRNNMWFTQPIHTKDLRLLGRNMDRVLIVDNSVGCCKLHPRNSLLVEDFHGVRRRSDAALVNVYYVVDALLSMMRKGATPVSEGLRSLAARGQLCHSVNYDLPEMFRCVPLAEVPELKRPPLGRFARANTAPPCASIMEHWVY